MSWENRFYKMDAAHHIIRVTFDEWCQIHDPENYSIAWTGNDDHYVSTVFLGINHNWFDPSGAPILFETMVFGGEHNEEQWRYCTYDEAMKGHAHVVKLVFGYVINDE